MTKQILATVVSVLGGLAAASPVEADALLIEFEGVFDYYDESFGPPIPALEQLLGTSFSGEFRVPGDIGPDTDDLADRSWHFVAGNGAAFSLSVLNDAYAIDVVERITIGVRDNAGPFGGPAELLPYEFADLVGFFATHPVEGPSLVYELSFSSSSAEQTNLNVLDGDTLPGTDILELMNPTFGILESGTGIYARPDAMSVSITTIPIPGAICLLLSGLGTNFLWRRLRPRNCT